MSMIYSCGYVHSTRIYTVFLIGQFYTYLYALFRSHGNDTCWYAKTNCVKNIYVQLGIQGYLYVLLPGHNRILQICLPYVRITRE